jgi:hypothetical protein
MSEQVAKRKVGRPRKVIDNPGKPAITDTVVEDVGSNPQEVKSQSTIAEQPSSLPLEAPKPIPEQSERIALKIVNGKFDISSVRPSNQERYKAIIRESAKDASIRKWAGLEAPQLQIISPSLIGNILDMAVNVEASIFSKKTGLEYDEVRRVLAWTVDEHKTLDDIGAKCVNKYIPPEWLEKMDLILFFGMVASLTTMKIKSLNDYAKKKFDHQVSIPSHDENKKFTQNSAASAPATETAASSPSHVPVDGAKESFG